MPKQKKNTKKVETRIALSPDADEQAGEAREGSVELGEGLFAEGLGKGSGFGKDPSEKYLAFDSSSPDTAFAQTFFYDLRDLKRIERMMMDVQHIKGGHNLQALIAVDLAARLSLKGYARGQALQVDTGHGGMVNRMRSFLRNQPDQGQRRVR